jgi:hypothetical protein
MPITLNGTTGVVTPGATVGSITGILKATSGVVSQAVAGTDYLTSTSGGAITLETAQTASGTAIDFTGIPSWAKRITVMFNGVSVSGTSNLQVQIGDSGGIEISGYVAASQSLSAATASTSGFIFTQSSVASDTWYGLMIISALNSTSWAYTSTVNNTGAIRSGAGVKTLSDTLNSLRITTVNGTDTFDAGTINISYE